MKFLFGWLGDLMEPCIWFFIRRELIKQGFQFLQKGECIAFGTKAFCCEMDEAFLFILETDESMFDRIKLAPICLIQETEDLCYNRVLNHRNCIPRWLEELGTEGLATAIVSCVLRYEEYREMNFMRSRFIRPDPITSVQLLLEWLKKHTENEEIINHYESYVRTQPVGQP